MGELAIKLILPFLFRLVLVERFQKICTNLPVEHKGIKVSTANMVKGSYNKSGNKTVE